MTDSLAGAPFTTQDVTDAYIYILGRFLVVRQETIDLSEDGVDYNVLKHNRAVGAAMREGMAPTFVNPNLDTVYSEAWIAVDEDTPALLTIPSIPAELYYTAQIVDEWAEITHNVNERNFPAHPSGRFAVCLAGSTPDIPAGALRIDIPSRKAKLLTRVQIGDDLERAVALQHGFGVASAGSARIEPTVPIEQFTNRALPGAEIFDQPVLDEALAATDVCPKAAEMHPLLRRISEYIAAGAAQHSAVEQIVLTRSLPALNHFMTSFGYHVNGWSSTAQYEKFGADYYFRAAANFGGIWWNSALEAVYLMAHTGTDGAPLTGDKSYTVTFAANELPSSAQNCFWSLTVLSKPDYMLVANPAHRYAVNGYTDLRYNSDGSLTLYLAVDRPAGAPAENWLPVPADRDFTATLRLYLPTEAVRRGQWSPGPLTVAG
ncbi:DUF1214 domain-containing protein [Nocardia sp. NBC_00416]|uniref:DUF1214 domain-containing protein n=1 Tax=Nocardia sp. NBC_00416 TaxID=2975991 RepID=UPI002E1FA12B